MGKLPGKTAVITGASSGIGAAIAKLLASEGANVVLTARRIEKLEEVAQDIKNDGSAEALAVQTDISNRDDVDNLINPNCFIPCPNVIECLRNVN